MRKPVVFYSRVFTVMSLNLKIKKYVKALQLWFKSDLSLSSKYFILYYTFPENYVCLDISGTSFSSNNSSDLHGYYFYVCLLFRANTIIWTLIIHLANLYLTHLRFHAFLLQICSKYIALKIFLDPLNTVAKIPRYQHQESVCFGTFHKTRRKISILLPLRIPL